MSLDLMSADERDRIAAAHVAATEVWADDLDSVDGERACAEVLAMFREEHGRRPLRLKVAAVWARRGVADVNFG